MKRLIALLFFAISNIAMAENIHLLCSGTLSVSGDDGISPQEFELDIDTKSGELYGFPLKIAAGCGNTPDVKQEIKKGSTKFGLLCTSDMGFSSLVLSRQTGQLETTTIFSSSKKIFSGQYKCKKVGKPLF